MGIEKDVLTDSDGKELGNLIEMPNGCLCCVVKDNLVIFLEKALEKFNEISVIVIEAHGLTDVSQVKIEINQLVQKMWLDKELESPLILNSIICMIDCYNFSTNYDENEEILKKQLICADKIILNKIDLVKSLPNSGEMLDNIKSIIENTNPISKIYEYDFIYLRTSFADISLNTFLEGLNLNANRFDDTDTIANNINCSGKQNCNCVSEDRHQHIHFAEKYKIENILVKINAEKFNQDELDKIIGDLLWNESEKHGFSIIRLKGVVYRKDELLYIQGIYDIYEINKLNVNESYDYLSKKDNSKILFIGRNLVCNESKIISKFE